MLRDERDYHRACAEVARLQGRLDAYNDLLLGDQDFMASMRAHAWLRADRTRVRPTADGQSVDCPDEWPEGCDGRAYALRYLETRQRRAELMAALKELDADG
ncbi:MAG TPA: hypothetical protein PKA13_10720 [Geminicoccaceae bacterium]|nr:hypothetical protein [Geminicoccus sp.]HMU50238.1 hypothetical protein [Geminicoccaceae bacterium]